MKPVATCLAPLFLALASLSLCIAPGLCTAQVTTSQYDNARTGAALNEKILTPQNINAQQFGKLTPFDQANILAGDSDVASSGPTLLPDQPGPHRHLLLQPTKHSVLYVIDRDQMGKFHADGDAIPQRIHMAGGGYGAVAYWNGHVFFAASDDYLRDYAVKNGQLVLHASSAAKFENPGATPSISANGKTNAIVWTIATKTWNGPDTKPAVLYAYDATKLGQPIYTSEQDSQRDRAAMAARFVIPVVVNGRVYLGTRSEVEVYGLLK